ncbi:MAG: hypothetical protein JST86_20165 [Bacteroidetes bacterium]|nr:hypothetical protein [Bacteroidota bacterium]
MSTQYSLHVVHPAFELLKRSARILHFIAAGIILVNAVHELAAHNGSKILCYTQMVIAADILILVFTCGPLLTEAPRLNFLFRFCEMVVLLGIAFSLLLDGHYWFSLFHFIIAGSYFFIMYREWRIMRSETVDISPTGITIPNFLKDMVIGWNEVKSIMPKYHSIIIETLRNQKIEFDLKEHLKIDELGQIDEFCKRHLSNG